MKSEFEFNIQGGLGQKFAQEYGLTSEDVNAISAGLLPDIPVRPDSIRVYLDLNHWISLAKALKGKKDAKRYEELLEFLTELSDSGKIVVPLSASHYMEISKISSIEQRSDIARVVSRVSHFATLQSPTSKLDFEVASAFRKRFPQLKALLPHSEIGFGFNFALGQGTGPSASISALDSDLYEVDRRDLQLIANRLMEYLVLRGPGPNDIPHLVDFDQYASPRIADQRAISEQRVREIVKASSNPRVSLRDVICARLFCDYVVPRLPSLLALSGVRKESFDALGKEWYCEFLEDVPFIAVQIALIIQINKNDNRDWNRNDVNDMDALGLAVPSCDIVVTERFACDVLNRSGIADRFQTVIIPTLDDLIREVKTRL